MYYRHVSTQDNSDAQYRSFRTNLPALAALMAGFFGLKYAYMRPILRDSSPANNLHRVPFSASNSKQDNESDQGLTVPGARRLARQLGRRLWRRGLRNSRCCL